MKRKNHIDLSILSYVCTFSLTSSQQTTHRYCYARFNFRFNPVLSQQYSWQRYRSCDITTAVIIPKIRREPRKCKIWYGNIVRMLGKTLDRSDTILCFSESLLWNRIDRCKEKITRLVKFRCVAISSWENIFRLDIVLDIRLECIVFDFVAVRIETVVNNTVPILYSRKYYGRRKNSEKRRKKRWKAAPCLNQSKIWFNKTNLNNFFSRLSSLRANRLV